MHNEGVGFGEVVVVKYTTSIQPTTTIPPSRLGRFSDVEACD